MGSSTMDLGMISKLLMDLDMSPEEYVQLNNEEIKQIMLERRERADAETAVSCHRSSVLAQQRAGTRLHDLHHLYTKKFNIL